MIHPPVWRAQSTRSPRRWALIVTPVGYWCAGVTTTAPTPAALSRSTSMPSSSRGIATVRKPVARSTLVWIGKFGSSIAIRSTPRDRSVSARNPSAELYPLTTRIEARSASTVLVRARNAASVVRSSGVPRGSGYANAESGASLSTLRTERSQRVRGNDAPAGSPGRKSWCGVDLRRSTSESAGAGNRSRCDLGTASVCRAEISLRCELFVHRDDRRSRQAKIGGQRARRGQCHPSGQSPIPDRET